MVVNPWIQLNREYWVCCKLLGRENFLRCCKHQSTLWEWLFTQTSLLGSAHSTTSPWWNSLYFLLLGFWKAPLNTWTVTEFKVCIFSIMGNITHRPHHKMDCTIHVAYVVQDRVRPRMRRLVPGRALETKDKSTMTLHGPRLLLQGNLAKGSVLVICSCVCNWTHMHTHLKTHTHASEGPFILRMQSDSDTWPKLKLQSSVEPSGLWLATALVSFLEYWLYSLKSDLNMADGSRRMVT